MNSDLLDESEFLDDPELLDFIDYLNDFDGQLEEQVYFNPDNDKRSHLRSPSESSSHFTSNSTSDGSTKLIRSDKLTKKERIERLRLIRSLAVPKNDIRRTYAKIFADCFNSGDFESLGRKLKDFCTDDCVCSDECKGPKRNPYLPPKVDIIGVEALMRYWGGMGCVMPDSVVTLHEAKIKVTTDSCRIVNSYTMVGTIMYDAYLVHNEFVDVNLDKKISLAIENNDNQTVGHSSEHDNGSTTNESDHGSSNTFEDGSSKKRRRLLQDSDELLLDSDPEIRESAALTTVTSTLSNVGQIVTTFAPINNGEDIVDGKRKKQTVVVLSDPTLPNAVVYPTSTIEISQNLSSMAGKITIKGSVTLHIDKQNNIFKIQGEYAIQ